MHCMYSVSERRYTTFTPPNSSTCGFYISRSHVQLHAMAYFFTCVSFVLYLKALKIIKYQIYYGLIIYLSLNDSLNLKSPPAIAITCKTTQQIIKKRRKKENRKKERTRKKERKKQTNKEETATTNKSPNSII